MKRKPTPDLFHNSFQSFYLRISPTWSLAVCLWSGIWLESPKLRLLKQVPAVTASVTNWSCCSKARWESDMFYGATNERKRQKLSTLSTIYDEMRLKQLGSNFLGAFSFNLFWPRASFASVLQPNRAFWYHSLCLVATSARQHLHFTARILPSLAYNIKTTTKLIFDLDSWSSVCRQSKM